ncbi:MAG: glycosyl transferase family 2 [Flavobacteriia bacterium]|nr:MAG: glycosyl transferase family 2 [Flavobacteriia bacterium]
MVQVSVVIVSYNVRPFLFLCLQSVTKALKSVTGEIIVVDNASTDDSCAMVKKHFPEVKLVENTDNVGFSKANNQGVELAQGTYVLILNPDTVIPENTFVSLLDFTQHKSDLGAVTAALYDGSGMFLPESKRNVPYPAVALKKLLGMGSSYYALQLQEDETGEIEVLVGAFMFLKKEVYQDVGGFDERYFMYGEDIDLSYALIQNGYKNYYYHKLRAIHFKGESTVKDQKYFNNFYEAMQLFYAKYFKRFRYFKPLVDAALSMKKSVHRWQTETTKEPAKELEHILYVGSENKIYEALIQLYAKANVHVYPVCETRTISRYDDMARLRSIIDDKSIEHLVFDAQNNSYEQIIYYMTALKRYYSDLSYDIRPAQSRFLIGSNDKNTIGHVSELDLN